ncbi:MAG: LUD domain-containing protein [Acidobacteriaceae bacterium]|nr:LUD domain-containing protein [Acidobacteriaceae bacterium]MBV9296631.1 LUD domain-containing protein [Acidobacteriaceae bacterium]MBV9766052.1 LUD domain-containing protein [Acidobacteriaceae bacterium]
MSDARAEIFEKIRRSTGSAGGLREAEYEMIPREYRQSPTLDVQTRLNLFVDRLHDYGASVHRCRETAIRETIAQALLERGKRGLLIPDNLPHEWLPDSFTFQRDKGLSFHEIDQSEGVLTGCAIAIAATGTIVLRHSPGEGRRALTLIPDYHLCVVFEYQVVETVAEGIREMEKLKTVPITTVSGPSATSDIEMTRIKGVHGPRILDVILARPLTAE